MSNYTKNGEATPKNAKEKQQDNNQTVKKIEPWPGRVDGRELFKELTSVFSRYLALQQYQAETLALWAIFSHCFDASDIAPKLLISSPEKGCGKSTLMEVMEGLAWKPLMASNITPAVIFRVIDMVGCTLMIDEADTFISKNEDMRGIINCGHKRSSAYVWRCAGDDNTPTKFSVWSPMVIAMIGKPADTIVDRSIIIEMRRRKKDEKIERFSYKKSMPELETLARKISRWCNDNFDDLCDADPSMPDGLRDRTMDNWRPLLAIADLIGNECSIKARKAAIELNKVEGDEDQSSASVMLLSDIRDVFESIQDNRISTESLLLNLYEMEDRPWADWNRGREITSRQVAKNLKPFGIKPTKIRFGHNSLRGYDIEQFQDAFDRYLDGTTEQANNINHLEENSSGTVPDSVPDENLDNSLKNNDCSIVPDEDKGKEWVKAPDWFHDLPDIDVFDED